MLNPVPTGWSIKSRSYFRFHAPVQIHAKVTVGSQGGSQTHLRAKASAATQGFSMRHGLEASACTHVACPRAATLRCQCHSLQLALSGRRASRPGLGASCRDLLTR